MSSMNKQRVIVTRLGIDLLRGGAQNILGEPDFGAALETQVITMAVSLGHLEGRPMTATKVSGFVGIPRTTVLRKLAALVAVGMFQRTSRGAYVFTPAAQDRQEVRDFMTQAISLIHRASAELSKMDG